MNRYVLYHKQALIRLHTFSKQKHHSAGAPGAHLTDLFFVLFFQSGDVAGSFVSLYTRSFFGVKFKFV